MVTHRRDMSIEACLQKMASPLFLKEFLRAGIFSSTFFHFTIL